MMYHKLWKQFLREEVETAKDPIAGPTIKSPVDSATEKISALKTSGDETTRVITTDSSIPSGTGVGAYLLSKGFYADEKLGAGMDGFVISATNKNTGQKVAVKFIRENANIHQDLRREVNNYKILMDNRDLFGQYSKYFPVVYSSEIDQVPSDGETMDGIKEETGVIFMEQLEPAPSSVSSMFFSGDPNKFKQDADKRDRRFFNNPDLVRDMISVAFEYIKVLNTGLKRFDRRMASGNINAKLPDILNLAGISAGCRETWDTNRIFRKKWTRSFDQLSDDVVDQLTKDILKDFYTKSHKKIPKPAGWDRFFNPNGLTLASIFVTKTFNKLFQSDRDVVCIKDSLMYVFMKIYQRPVVSGADKSIMKPGSSLRGIDQFSDSEKETEISFPESKNVRDALKIFAMVTGLKPFDVHSGNVMMRPGTNDIVVIDLGRFR